VLTVCLADGCVRRLPPTASQVPPRQAPPSATSAPAEITFAYWALAPREIETVHRLVERFEAENPSVKVRLVEVTDRYYDKLTTLFSTNNAPDAFSVNYGRLGDFARRGLLADLGPLVAGSAELDRSQFVPAAYDSFASVGAAVGRPGLFALPRDWGPTNLLVYNKDAFDAAGLGYPSAEWTWEQFAQACRRLTIVHPGGALEQYGAAVCLYPYALAGWVYQSGGDFLSPDRGQSTLASERVVDAVEFLNGLVDEGVVAPASAAHDESQEQFQRRKAAMAFVSPYGLGDLREQEGLSWGIAPPLKGRRQATGCIPTGIAMSASSGRREPALRFMAYWVTEAARQVAEAGYCVPAWRPALESRALEAGYGPQTAGVLRAAVEHAAPHPVSRHLPYELMLDHLKQALDEVFVKGTPPRTALQTAQEALNARSGDAP